ncbi:MAG: peptidoglycan-binding protein, partial [Candidatus Binatia bacterium]
LNAVVREQGFRRMVNEDTAVRIGKLAGAQAIVIANVYNTSSQHHQGFQGGSGNFLVDTVGKMVDPSGMVQTVEMGVKMIDVQTAEVVWSDTKTERSRPGATTSHTEVLRQLVASLAFPADPSAPSGEISAGTGASGEGPCRHSPYVPEAREFQRTLRRLGYKIGQADGCLGEKTHTALRQFQRDQGLEITGELDDATKEALRGPVVKAPRETERAEPPPDDSEGSEQEIY